MGGAHTIGSDSRRSNLKTVSLMLCFVAFVGCNKKSDATNELPASAGTVQVATPEATVEVSDSRATVWGRGVGGRRLVCDDDSCTVDCLGYCA